MDVSNALPKWLLLLLLTLADHRPSQAALEEMTFQVLDWKFSGDQKSVRVSSLVACAARCLLLSPCGAFAWNSLMDENCLLFEDPRKDDPESPMVQFYGGTVLSTGKKLLKRPSASPDFVTGAHEVCRADGLLLVQNPTTPRDRSMVASYRRFPLDLTRSNESMPYVNSRGDIVDTTMFRDPVESNTITGDEECVAGHFYNLWELGCSTWDLKSDITLCQEE